MSHAEVNKAVTSCGIQCRHMDWGDERPPKLPWAVYMGDEAPIVSDDTTSVVRYDWTVELYEAERDKDLEERLGAAILQAFGPYRKREVWVSSEKCLMVTYDFTEIETYEGDTNGSKQSALRPEEPIQGQTDQD